LRDFEVLMPPSTGLIVGLGASAGGLEALQQLFAHVPAETGLVFVVVQHLDPSRPSLLAELLARHTALGVVEAADGVCPEPDHVYVIPPGAQLRLAAGAFAVTPVAEAASRGAVDAFFCSLAEERGERAVGVVLSGAGHDGAVGLRAIRARGGLTLAQAPETAKHDSMPQGVIGAGLADHVLPPEQMPRVILEHAGYVGAAAGAAGGPLEAQLAGALDRICTLIRQQTGHDFARYKEGTLVRRIQRRLQVLHVTTIDEYLQRLAVVPTEAEALVKDLLIGVTQFFRDPAAFEALAHQVLPLVVTATDAAPVRIWVPGCASGEEAYSLAILVREHLERLGARRSVQLFATDLDAEMLAEARHGRYALAIAEHLTPARLARFFAREGQWYQATKELREMCIFSQHSLIRDPPFSQLDLISCRNVLIYLSAELQQKLIPLFHYALRPGGFLLLGPSESTASAPELFDAVDKKSRIFRRQDAVKRPVVEFPLAPRAPRPPVAAPPGPAAPAAPTPRARLAAAFERLVLDEYSWPSLVVDERGEIVLAAGPVGRFLQPAAGALSSNLLDAARGSLRRELRAALAAAAQSGRRVVRDRLTVELEDTPRQVRLVVRPMPAADNAPLYLVVLQESAPDEDGEPAAAPASQPDAPALQQLEGELRATRAELRASVEAADAANEELQSANEELLSTNEELQSANEELQTSKEELQSLNEELETVNTELRQKLEELAAANSDLQNLFAATEIATIFLDRALRVAKFTPAATALFHLIDSDVGRPLADLAPRFAGQDLVADAREVLRALAPVERQVRAADGAWFVLRLLPYRTGDNVVAGVVVTFVDVSRIRRAEGLARRQAELLELSHDAIFVRRFDGTIESWNHGAEELYGYGSAEAIGRISHELLGTAFPQPLAAIEAELRAGGCWAGELRHRTRDGRIITVLSDLQLGRGDDGVELLLEANRDITERKRVEAELRRNEEQTREIVDSIQDPFYTIDQEWRVLFANEKAREVLRRTRAELVGQVLWDLFPQAKGADSDRELRAAMQERRVVHYETRSPVLDRWLEVHAYPTARGGLMVTFRDITERKTAEVRLAYLASFPANNPNPIVEASVDGLVRYMNPTARDLLPDLAAQGAAHPWLVDWPLQVERSRAAGGSACARLVAVGDRVYHQSLSFVPEMGVIRIYGLDVTGREQAEAAIRRSRQTFAELIERAPFGIYVVDAAFRVAMMNIGSQRGAFHNVRPVIGRPFDEAMHILWPDTVAAEIIDRFRHTLATGEPYHSPHFTNPRNDVGTVESYEWELHRIELPDGQFGVICYYFDSTELRTAEAALREANQQLVEANQHKNQFLAVLSHELRNPLTPITNSLFILDQAAPGSKQARRAQAVLARQTDQLARLVDDLLDVTRVTQNKIQLQRQRVELNEFVQRTVDDHQPEFEQVGVALELTAAPTSIYVSADTNRLAQIIGNLLQNSAKFTRQGGTTRVEVATDVEGRRAVVRVTDDGIGMSPQMLSRLFVPFSQADVSLDRRKGGLGLGLALVKGLVDLHGGEISAHSEGLGRGAAFTVRMPLDRAADVVVAGTPDAAPAATGRRRVLIIEDNADAAESLCEALRFGDHEVAVAYNGPDGIARARELRPDVVLCDIGLPGMDGYEVARALRRDDALRDVVLVALTGYALPEDVQRAAEAGFEQHLAKPPSLEKLQQLLAHVPART
jgi:two-component system, chemotaxis family, CheB/CheR fusion protein